jgi:hypothetical protein
MRDYQSMYSSGVNGMVTGHDDDMVERRSPKAGLSCVALRGGSLGCDRVRDESGVPGKIVDAACTAFKNFCPADIPLRFAIINAGLEPLYLSSSAHTFIACTDAISVRLRICSCASAA